MLLRAPTTYERSTKIGQYTERPGAPFLFSLVETRANTRVTPRGHIYWRSSNTERARCLFHREPAGSVPGSLRTFRN